MSWFSGSSTQKELEDTKKKLESVKAINENLTNAIVELKSKFEEKEKEIDELKNKLQHKEELKYASEENSPEKYYDIIIDINSLKGIKKGWKIKWTDENSKNYKNLKNNKSIKIGVIGNGNKGKSFILQKFSGKEIPKGTNIKTEGLSLLYKNKENNNNNKEVLLLDSAGFETPLLKNTIEDGEIDDEQISIIARDKIFTELFLQELIIEFSDIILIVIGLLTFSEQKLLNRIKKNIIKNKKKNKSLDKTIIIIHNLQNFVEKEQVEKYLKEVLLNSATFSLTKLPGTIRNNKNGEEINGFFYKECYSLENQEINICHLIMANDGSNAGNYYNEYAIYHLWNLVSVSYNWKEIDVIQEIQNHFIEFSKQVFEYNINSKDNKKIQTLTKEDIIFDEKENSIKLKNDFEIKFKKLLVNELGISNFRNNNCDPKYSYYKKKEENASYFVVKVEIPGNYENLNGIASIEHEYTLFKISGKKLKDDDDKINTSIKDVREYGEFGIILPLLTSEIRYLNKKAIIDKNPEKGIISFSFLIDDDN